MKNFDLEAAKRGAAVCTRDGRNARIIAFDCKGRGSNPILALIDMGDWEQSASWTKRGEIIEDLKGASDLMMRDDDYLEKLERGEYGNHIVDANEMVVPTCKDSLQVGLTKREWFAGMAMAGEISGFFAEDNSVGGKKYVLAAITEGAVLFADALIAELEKDEKVL